LKATTQTHAVVSYDVITTARATETTRDMLHQRQLRHLSWMKMLVGSHAQRDVVHGM